MSKISRCNHDNDVDRQCADYHRLETEITNLEQQRNDLLEACKTAMAWFDKHTNDEPVWEDQPSADMATLMQDAIAQAEK
ncbi:hypothetical protein LCGC14_1134210 [marine sediment metagenome]|uniref:Coil containing protein n=1 Tax=marine sediment metagenome TaxID=412755 RepID=A0A0F9PIH7_9ZZZZ